MNRDRSAVKNEIKETRNYRNDNVGVKALTLKFGRLYYTKAFERKLFFFLTLSMLLSGLLMKLGIL